MVCHSLGMAASLRPSPPCRLGRTPDPARRDGLCRPHPDRSPRLSRVRFSRRPRPIPDGGLPEGPCAACTPQAASVWLHRAMASSVPAVSPTESDSRWRSPLPPALRKDRNRSRSRPPPKAASGINWPPPNTPTAWSCTWAPEWAAPSSPCTACWAIGFAASALAFAARDEWIGRQPQMRRKRLRCVPVPSRLPIRPASCPPRRRAESRCRPGPRLRVLSATLCQ